MREARQKSLDLRFHFHEMCRTGLSMETQSRPTMAGRREGGRGEGRWEEARSQCYWVLQGTWRMFWNRTAMATDTD